jgi:hypothetical protein
MGSQKRYAFGLDWAKKTGPLSHTKEGEAGGGKDLFEHLMAFDAPKSFQTPLGFALGVAWLGLG